MNKKYFMLEEFRVDLFRQATRRLFRSPRKFYLCIRDNSHGEHGEDDTLALGNRNAEKGGFIEALRP